MTWRCWVLLAGWGAAGASGTAAEVRPVMVQSAPGRFEVAAEDGAVAHAVATAADEAWAHLAQPLGLPPAFSSPILVRVLGRAEGDGGKAPFEAVVEPGGVVSLHLRSGAMTPGGLRAALAHGLLARQGVSWLGGGAAPVVPWWLELACAGWWETRLNPAQLDAWKQRAAAVSPVPVAAVLDGRRAGGATLQIADAALGLMLFLQAESGRDGEWLALVRRLLAGMDPQAALAASYPGRFHGVEARELWWQTGWHHQARVRALPVLEAAESRWGLSALARFVFAAAEGEGDAVVSLAQVLERRAEPLVAAELSRRAGELGRLIPALHPFYRNAGLSLAEAFAIPAGPRETAKIPERCRAFADDWAAGTALEAATDAALEALERRAAGTKAANPG